MKKTFTILLIFYSIALFSQSNERVNDNNIYPLNSINVKPEFVGGIENLNSYLLESGFKTKEKGATKFFGFFVVEKDGSLSDVKFVGKIEPDKIKDLISLLKNSPKWHPGKMKDQIVRTLYSLPLYLK